VNEKRGPFGKAGWRRLARVEWAFFVLPFSFVSFLLGKQKKRKLEEDIIPTLIRN
jgi:hypothetical protein